MAKTYTCTYCNDPVNELGAYVKIAANERNHLTCYKNQIYAAGKVAGRSEVLLAQAQAQEDAQKNAFESAKFVYESALRCQRCGVTMLADRPSALPLSYSTVAPSSGVQGVCADCVRKEVQARAAARQTQAPSTAAQAIQQAPTRAVQAQKETERPIGEPGIRQIEID